MIPLVTTFEIHMSADGKNICDKCVHKSVCRKVKELFAPCVKCNHFMEVVHGHWNSLTDCSNAGVYCSVCHKKVWKEDYAWCNRKNKLRSNYCPNCGADMR